MFLPVLLLRDFGVWGYVAFAAPNVIGAAAMGWVLRDDAASPALVQRHGRAVAWFSAVTIAFQAWFLVCVISLFGDLDWGVLPRVAVLAGLAIFGAAFTGGPGLGLGAWVVSFGVAVAYLLLNGPPALPAAARGIPVLTSGVLWLAPVCCFGFALCPYLDGTFHKARTALDPRGARRAFTLGFGVLFFLMILFTLVYAGEFLGRSSGSVFLLVLVHMTLQAGYTCGVHLRAIANLPRGGGVRSIPWWAGITSIAIVFAAIYRRYEVGAGAFAEIGVDPFFELIYRIFMSFYGLVFPAYVWLCMIPVRGRGGPTWSRLIVWTLVIGLAAPMFWMGFIERREWWLGPGLALVLAARVVVVLLAGRSEHKTV